MLPVPRQSLMKHHLPLASWELVTFFYRPWEFGRRKLLNYVGVCSTRMCCSAQANRPFFVQSFHKYVGDVYSGISFRLPVVFLEIVCFFFYNFTRRHPRNEDSSSFMQRQVGFMSKKWPDVCHENFLIYQINNLMPSGIPDGVGNVFLTRRGKCVFPTLGSACMGNQNVGTKNLQNEYICERGSEGTHRSARGIAKEPTRKSTRPASPSGETPTGLRELCWQLEWERPW